MNARKPETLPRSTWIVGQMEIHAPANWTEAQVLAAARSAPLAVRAPPPRSIAFYQKDMETIGDHRWCATAYAAWREDAPHPVFSFRQRPVDRQRMEMFLGGRKLARREFPWRLFPVDEPPIQRSGRFTRADGQQVRIACDYAPWWPLLVEQEDDAKRGMIRVTRDGEAIAYCMPFRLRERASA
jgi:hypothetical protein